MSHHDRALEPTLPARGAAVSWRRSWFVDRGVDLVIFLWLFLASETILPLLMIQGQEDLSDSQKLILQNLLKPFVIFSCLFLMFQFKKITLVLMKQKILLAIIFWMWLSSFWSLDYEVTVRRSLLLSSTIIIACFVVLRYSFEEIMKILFAITIFVFVFSVYFIVVDPSLGFNPDGRGARGAFMHKNTLANFLVVGIAVSAAVLHSRLVPRLLGYSMLTLSLVLLVLANSTTALLIVAVMFAVYLMIEVKAKIPFRYFAMLLAFVVSAALFSSMLLIANIEEVFSLLGRDTTLTGRNEVWNYALDMISQRRWWGYGYSAFWESEPILSYVTQTLNWHITHAHNGYLEVWLELGLIGLGLMIVFLLISVTRVIFGNLPHNVVVFVLPFFVGMIVSDFAETHLFVYKHFGWMVMLIFVFLTTPGLKGIKSRQGRQA